MSETSMAAGRGAVSAFAAHCEWTGASADNRENWLISRREGIGGSDVAVILGCQEDVPDKYRKSALELYVEKTSNAPPDGESSEVADWGRMFEPLILKYFATRTGRRVVRGGKLMRSTRDRHHLVTLDGVQLSKPPPGCRGPGIAEVKTTGFASAYEGGIPPVRVQVQLQWELWVTGATWGSVIWLPFPERRMAWWDCVAHRQFQEETLVPAVDEFWRRVKRRLPPDPDGSDSARRALFAINGGQTEEAFRLLDAAAVTDEYERNKLHIALLERRQQYIKNVLAATMGTARHAVLEDGRYWGASFVGDKEQHCPHCAGVIGSRSGYRSHQLRAPRKKAFTFTGQPRALCVDLGAEDAALTKALSESIVGAPAPSNDPEKETA